MVHAKRLWAHESHSSAPETPARARSHAWRLLCEIKIGQLRPSETSQVIIGLLQNGVDCIVYLEWIFCNEFDGF